LSCLQGCPFFPNLITGWFYPLDRAVSRTISFYGRVTNASLGLLTQEAIWPLAVSQTISIWLSDKIAHVAQPFLDWLLIGMPLLSPNLITGWFVGSTGLIPEVVLLEEFLLYFS